MKAAGASVSNGAIGPRDLKKTLPLNRNIERVAGVIEVTLFHNHLGRRRARSQADLKAGGVSLRALRGSGNDDVLVNHVLELQLALAEAGGAGVRQVVGNCVQIGLLRAHSASGCV